MAKPIERDGAFYHRARVPNDIVATFGKTRTGKPQEDLWLPIGKTLPEAKRNLPIAMVDAQERFDAHRKAVGGNVVLLVPRIKMSTKPAVAVAGSGEAFCSVREAVEFYSLGIDQIECQMRADATAKALADPDAFWRGEVIKLAPNVKPEMGIGAALAASYRDRMARKLQSFHESMEIMDLSYAQLFVCAVFPGCENRLLMIECARAEIEYMESKLKRPGSVFFDLPSKEQAAADSGISEVPLMSVAAAKWRALKVREGWTHVRMLPLLDTSVALLIEVCGDKSLNAYRKADVADYKDILSRLPKHRFKKKATKHLGVRRAADVRGLPIIGLKTANDYINTVSSLFDWARLSYEGVSNPFDGAAFNIKSDQREEKDPFSLEDLKSIFGSLQRADDAKFWAPILALYMGGRSQEILKLKVTDVRREDETVIWYFDINEEEHADVFQVDGKPVRVHHKLKRPSHKRRIPVHADLVALGFLDFVKRCGSERIFAERRPNKHGKFSDAYPIR